MARLSWIFVGAVVTLVAAPVGCFFVNDNGPGGVGPGGVGGSFGAGGGSAPTDECNPVTAAGCPSDGYTCDFDQNSGLFKCFPPPNSVAVCGACDQAASFCAAELTCVLPAGGNEGTCYRYCCTDADCGAGATCDTALAATVLVTSNSADKVGLCVQGSGAACGSPSAAPSGGSCVGGYSPGGGTGGGSGTGGSHAHHDGGTDGGGTGGNTGDGGGTGGGVSGTGGGGTGDGGMPIPDGGHAGRGDGG